MRIGMLADTYKPHISGITNYISLNKRALEQEGHQVFIFTFGDEDYQDDETNVIRSPGLPLVDTGYYLGFSYRRAARRLLYTMDVVHVHHPFMTGSLALRLCRPRGIPIVFTNHTRYDLYSQAYLPALPEAVSATLLQAYLPAFCRSCDLVIAPSEGLRKVLAQLGVDQHMEVVPNGVDLEPFLAPKQPCERATFGFNPDDVVLVYVGRLGPEKNLSFLLRSFAGTSAAFDHVRLLVVGDGPEKDNLMAQALTAGIQDKVHFTGLVPYTDLPNYLACADAFVTASVTEVHPLSVIEAMAAGLPTLGIESPGVGDTIEDGQTGFLSQPDIAAFTAKMVLMATGHELRKQMGQQAQGAAQRYSIDRTSKIMLTHYQPLADRAHQKQRGFRYRISRFYDRWTT